MDIEKKYSKELDAVKKYIRNDYIYEIFKNYGFSIYDKDLKKTIFINLNSNINVYEACFIALCIQIYISKFYEKSNNLNILELGLAYGTSSLIIANELVLHSQKFKSNINYDIIDKYQSTAWKNIGLQNLNLFIKDNKYINYKLYEDFSRKIMSKFKKNNNKYDIIFIDGAHDEFTVFHDIYFSHKMLKINGIMILDDVLHEGVKKAIKKFLYKYSKYYRRISIDESQNFRKEYKVYTNDMYKKNFFNPSTMYCFQKKTE